MSVREAVRGLPENFDAEIFVGRTIELICFSVTPITFHFDDDISVVVMGPFSLEGGGTTVVGEGDEALHSESTSRTQLLRLVGTQVVGASGARDGTLALRCESGDVLRLFDTPMYEAYTISHRGQVLIV